MARPLRIEYPGAIYHITARGNTQQPIFLNDQDRNLFLCTLEKVVNRYNWLCHAYCLMDNHYHLLIETIDPTLSLGMRQLNGVYTQQFNRAHNRVGHVFQGRYKSIVVEKGAHLLELCRYIVLNPVKARMVHKPDDWRWSSYNATAGLERAPELLSCDWLLSQFSKRKKDAQQQYTAFVADGMSMKGINPWQHLKGQLFLGGNEFVAKMQKLADDKKEIGEIPRTQRYAGRPALDELLRGVTNKQERTAQIVKAHLDHGYTLKEIAQFLGIHYTTVSKVIKKVTCKK